MTTLAAAVGDGYSLDASYDCPASVTVDGHVFNNDFGNGGNMSLQEALILSCDTIFYNFGYQMWQQDQPYPNVNVVTKPSAPVQKMQKMELRWGFGQFTGIDLPEESEGTIPTREWLYYFWKDNAHTGQDWCKYGKANGSYIQQIEYQDCHYGNIWEPGLAVDAAIGQGYVAVTPLQLARAYAALANGGTLYSPRIGEALISPDGGAQKITPPVAGRLPVAGEHPGLYQDRPAGRGDVGHRGGRVRRIPAQHGVRGREDRYRPGIREPGHLGVRLVRPLQRPQVRGRGDDPQFGIRRRRVRPGGPPDLGRDLRPRGS